MTCVTCVTTVDVWKDKHLAKAKLNLVGSTLYVGAVWTYLQGCSEATYVARGDVGKKEEAVKVFICDGQRWTAMLLSEGKWTW